MEKEIIRKQTMDILKNLTSKQKNDIEDNLRQHFIQSQIWKQSKVVGITISRGVEWDTKKIIEAGWAEGKEMVVPKCYPDMKKLEFYRLASFEELETVYYNLLEPKPIAENKVTKELMDLIIVPGVVFNQDGYRIGFGGGYYDRFLSNYKGETVSLLSTLQLNETIPIESHDIPVKYLLSENGFIK